jgi:hypothetical protein
MSITPTSGPANFGGLPPSPPKMTDSQKTATQEILAGYDPEHLTESDIKAIQAAFKAEGIRPSPEHAKVIDSTGFNVEELPPLIEGSFTPSESRAQRSSPPKPESSSNSAMFLDILKIIDSGQLDESIIGELRNKLAEGGNDSFGNLIDATA